MAEQRHALVVCDVQHDALQSLTPPSTRHALLTSIHIAIDAASRRGGAGYTIIFSGLRFPKGYAGVSPHHRLYGALKRLNDKMGGDGDDGNAAHWFMEGYDGSNFEPSLSLDHAAAAGEDTLEVEVVWRQTHLPSPELLAMLRSRSITKVTIVGIKAGYAVQSTVQALCDEALQVSVVRECVSDDNAARMEAVMEHVIPVYADVVSLEQFIDETVGLERYAEIVKKTEDDEDDEKKTKIFYISDCGRGGHMALYASHLLQRPGWSRYPLQRWYTDHFTGKQYLCPLGKKVLHFADEPQFSQLSMYLKGREWLDDKEKVIQLAGNIMPDTYVLEGGKWVGGSCPPPDDEAGYGPWFVKECDKNGGRAVRVCRKPSDCMAVVADIDPRKPSSYVVQAHIVNPLLTDTGHKCHVKFYSLLQCDADGISWVLHTYQDAFLCISPNPWSSDDISTGTQVTIQRHKRMFAEQEEIDGLPTAWYDKCREGVATVVGKAISENKLRGRPGKRQFELFSADFIFDASGKAWLIEFNFGPVLFDPLAGQELTTPGLKEYQRLYDIDGEKAAVNDRAMIADALSMVFFPQEDEAAGRATTRWDPAGSYKGEATARPTDKTAAALLRPFASSLVV